MAEALSAKPNVDNTDSDYPNGTITDDTGAGDGTPVNREVYGDFHQFFAELLKLGFITPNGLPDNVVNGYQYRDALMSIPKKYKDIVLVSSNPFNLTVNDYDKLIYIAPMTPVASTINLPVSGVPQWMKHFRFVNMSPYKMTIAAAGSDTIGAAPSPFTLRAGQFLELVYIAGDYIISALGTLQFALSKQNMTSYLAAGWSVDSVPIARQNSDGLNTFQGTISKTGGPYNGTIATLPVGSRFLPGNDKDISININDSGVMKSSRLTIQASGVITIDTSAITTGTSVKIYLDGVDYYND